MIPNTKPPPIYPNENVFTTQSEGNNGITCVFSHSHMDSQVSYLFPIPLKRCFNGFILSILYIQNPRPPSYSDIPGTVPVHQGVSTGPPPTYEETTDPNGELVT